MAERWTQLQLPAELMPRAKPTTSRPAPIEARAEIVRLLAAGAGIAGTARSLNARGIPTPSGRGQWWPATVTRHVEPGPWAAYVRRYRSTRNR